MKSTDDILNRYIDGELSDSELAEFYKELESSPGLRRKLDLMKKVDSALQKAEPESPSAMFTANVMKRLRKKSSFAKSQNYFIIFVAGLFFLLSVGILVYIVTLISASSPENGSTSLEIGGYLNQFVNDLLAFTRNVFSPKYSSYLGSLVSMLVIVTGYFFFEHNRKLIKKANR